MSGFYDEEGPFDSDAFMRGTERLQFKSLLNKLFTAVAKRGWKVKLTLWNPNTGEEWEVIPTSSTQTKRPTERVQVEVRDPEMDMHSPN